MFEMKGKRYEFNVTIVGPDNQAKSFTIQKIQNTAGGR
jgi:hypothetical protein